MNAHIPPFICLKHPEAVSQEGELLDMHQYLPSGSVRKAHGPAVITRLRTKGGVPGSGPPANAKHGAARVITSGPQSISVLTSFKFPLIRSREFGAADVLGAMLARVSRDLCDALPWGEAGPGPGDCRLKGLQRKGVSLAPGALVEEDVPTRKRGAARRSVSGLKA